MADKDDERAWRRFERAAEWRVKNEGAAAGPIGQKIVQESVQPLINFIDLHRGASRPTQRKRLQKSLVAPVWDLIKGVPSDVLAGACLAGVLNYNRAPLKDDENPTMGRSMDLIGREVERQVEFWKLSAAKPKLGKRLERAAARKPKREDRWKVVKPHAETWPPKVRREAGNWAYDCCLQALPHIFEKGKYGPQVKEAAAEADLRDVYVKPFYVPSLRKSPPWTKFNNANGEPFLRHTRLSVADLEAVMLRGQMRPHMRAVSYLQATPCAINEPVLDFVRQGPLVELERSADRRAFDYDMAEAERVRGQPFYIDMSCDHRGRVYGLPYFNYSRGDHIRALFKFARGAPITEKGIWWLKVAAANCYDENGTSRRPFEERVAWTERNLDRIHQIAAAPWSGVLFDGEGHRLAKGANPEGAEPPVWKVVDGELVFQCPEVGNPWLAAAKDPHQFLAHAIELVAALKEGPGFITTLPVVFDASNSGAQHYALLMRDRHLAELTNLIDADEPRDLYSEFGKRIEDLFVARLREIGYGDDISDSDQKERGWMRWLMRGQKLHERKAQKGFAVAWIYGSGDRRQKAALGRRIREEFRVPEFQPGREVLDADGEPTRVREIVRRWLSDDEVPKEMVKWFIERQYRAMRETAPSIVEAMRFIQSLSVVLPRPLEWVSPSGVPVRNLSWKTKTSALSLWLGAGAKKPSRNVGAVGYEREPDAGDTLRAGPPNFIHSLDAAHLARVALACKRARIPLLTVHDSFATLPCHADKLREILLREMRKMHAECDWLAELGPNRPPPGDLKIEEVRGRFAFG